MPIGKELPFAGSSGGVGRYDVIPINTFLAAYITVYLSMAALDMAVDFLNAHHIKKRGGTVPEGFDNLLDLEKLKRMHEYSLAQSKLGMVERVTGWIILLVVILSGLLPLFQTALADFSLISGGLLFFAVLASSAAMVGLPFEAYRIFSIEERFGFNRRTLSLWIWDLAKSLLLSVTLGGTLLSLILLLLNCAGKNWWIGAWLVFFFFQILVLLLYPTVIAPLFNKFTPLENHPLGEKIRSLAESQGLTVKGIFQMDAGRRSRHTNAYLAGLGKTRRIVLFDTLLEAHRDDEILAVLAHEMGHLKKGHIWKQLWLTGTASAFFLFLASWLMRWQGMYESFGFVSKRMYVGLLLVGLLWEPLSFFVTPLAIALSRRYEREADRYAAKVMGSPEPLVSALKKMVLDNLSNLSPHPIYVIFHYSHPPVLERIKHLQSALVTKSASDRRGRQVPPIRAMHPIRLFPPGESRIRHL
jgi:STE24 endopeptidase